MRQYHPAGWRHFKASAPPQRRRALIQFSTFGLGLVMSLTASMAQAPSGAAPTTDINEHTVGIVTGTVSGTYIQFASDLSNVLDSPGKLRILAVLGKGSMQNVEDISRFAASISGSFNPTFSHTSRKEACFPRR